MPPHCLDPVSIGGLWGGIPFAWDVAGVGEVAPILFLTFKNPCSPCNIIIK